MFHVTSGRTEYLPFSVAQAVHHPLITFSFGWSCDFSSARLLISEYLPQLLNCWNASKILKDTTYAHEPMDSFFTTITWLGSLYLLLPLSVPLCFLLLWSGKSGQAMLISLSLLINIISVHVAKLMFRRPRPSTAELLVAMPSDWSFPSAHTAQATAFFLSVTVSMMPRPSNAPISALPWV